VGDLKGKINYLETKSKNKNISDLYRSISEFEKGHRFRIYFMKDESGNPLENSHSILVRWKNSFCQLLNVCGVKDVT
jgi:hypothetical protein